MHNFIGKDEWSNLKNPFLGRRKQISRPCQVKTCYHHREEITYFTYVR